MSDRQKPSTFTKYAKGLLSRPTTSNSQENKVQRAEHQEVATRPTAENLCHKVDAALSAIASSPDYRQVVVAGREILKILSVGPHGVREIQNLRAHQRMNMSYSANDVKWGIGPANGLVATATSNGSIVLWNVDYSESRKIERAINGHNRAANRLAFNPANGSWLLSASQDGSMKLWDLRDRESSARFVLHGKAEAVRDVQFNSTNALELAAVYDNGTLQKWDLRNPKIYERKLNAHHGLALAVDWHADGRHVATGGRDKIIKIWDMASDMRKPLNYLTTMAPVARVAWRPGGSATNCQIASCSFSMDNNVTIWNLRRPHIPERIVEAHDNVATGIMWKDKDILWSCSKDRTFRQHIISTAAAPIDSLSHYAFGWSNTGDIALCLGSRSIDKERLHKMQLGAVAMKRTDSALSNDSRDTKKDRLLEEAQGFNPRMKTFKPVQTFAIVKSEGSDASLFRHLALNYSTVKENPIKACGKNALVAQRVQRPHLSKSWKVIKLALEHIDRKVQSSDDSRRSSEEHSASTSRLGESLIHRDLERLRGTPNLNDSNLNTMRANSPNPSFIMPRYSDHGVLPFSLPASAVPSRPRTADSAARASNSTRTHTPEKRISQTSRTYHNPDGIILPTPADFQRRQSSASWCSSDALTNLTNERHRSHGDIPTFSPIVSRRPSSGHNAGRGLEVRSPWLTPSIPTLSRPLSRARSTGDKPDRKFSVKAGQSSLQRTVRPILDHYRELGDVQTCATISLILADSLDLPEKEVEEWLYCYVDLLQRRGLFVTAAEVINGSQSDLIRSLSEADNVAHTSCSRCRQSVPLVREKGDYWMCTRCQNTVLCIVCGIVIKGAASWCFSCAHAAHPGCRSALRAADLQNTCVAPDCGCECFCP